jgi:2-polyprenyl-6-methoxyphenol hydroxylase-like FAD-dependent oxidoreductase
MFQSLQREIKFPKQRKFSHFPVAIIGGGPVGMMMSALLSNYKVRHALIEKRAEITKHPQAHFINIRSMEILQSRLPEVFENVVNASIPAKNWR